MTKIMRRWLHYVQVSQMARATHGVKNYAEYD
jgi:hypothetical protein